MSPRWVLMHIKNLPQDSATVSEIRGGQQFRGWDTERYQLALIADSIRALLYVFIVAHTDKNKRKPKPPEPWPTPDQKTRQRKQQSTPGSFAHMAATQIAAVRRKKGGG